jgi:hypothetical protein
LLDSQPRRAPPHPYFVSKILVFLSLQAWLRCKILKTMKFPAKSSRERSYALFRPLSVVYGWKTDGLGRTLPESLCDEMRKSSANIRSAADAHRAWDLWGSTRRKIRKNGVFCAGRVALCAWGSWFPIHSAKYGMDGATCEKVLPGPKSALILRQLWHDSRACRKWPIQTFRPYRLRKKALDQAVRKGRFGRG